MIVTDTTANGRPHPQGRGGLELHQLNCWLISVDPSGASLSACRRAPTLRSIAHDRY